MTTEVSAIPHPPIELMQRVGRIDDGDVAAGYEQVGRHCRARIDRLLPADWSWEGRRVLDFGCGAGRTLRHFRTEAENAEFHACDIDGASIAWLEAHLSPPFRVFQNSEEPRLPQPNGFFDVVYAFSVFTHLAESSADWLLELHRVLKPDGLLISTFLNEGAMPLFGGGEWEEDRIGMNVLGRWKPWDSGGPIVFHSEWWLREHWGRAFDLLTIERYDPHEHESLHMGQGCVVMRARPNPPDAGELMEPGTDPRELAALRHNVDQLQREADELFDHLSQTTEARRDLVREVERLDSELEEARRELASANDSLGRIAKSQSWRLTAPLRAGAAVLRTRGNR
jgi:SAM-dependent methyltransferase